MNFTTRRIAYQVSVPQSGGAVFPRVTFRDDLDLSCGFMGNTYDHVTGSSLARLAKAINSLGMEVSIDIYGVPTWNRKHPEDCPGCDYCSDRWTNE